MKAGQNGKRRTGPVMLGGSKEKEGRDQGSYPGEKSNGGRGQERKKERTHVT